LTWRANSRLFVLPVKGKEESRGNNHRVGYGRETENGFQPLRCRRRGKRRKRGRGPPVSEPKVSRKRREGKEIETYSRVGALALTFGKRRGEDERDITKKQWRRGESLKVTLGRKEVTRIPYERKGERMPRSLPIPETV